MRSQPAVLALLLMTTLGGGSAAQADDGPFTLVPLKKPAPDAIAKPVRDALMTEGYQILNDTGAVYAEIWLRKPIPVKTEPAEPQGNILHPELAEGELLGVLRFPKAANDFRDQLIDPGVYTIRYGQHPVDGNHQDVNEYRDFALLLPIKADKDIKPLERKALEKNSAETTGTAHPAVLPMWAAESAAEKATLIHHEEKRAWSVLVPASVAVKGSAKPSSKTLKLQFVIAGAAV